MEKHKCKLCFKSFANGRALGGHMRSHVMNLYSPPKSDHHHHQQQQPNFDHQFGAENDSAPPPSSSSSSSGEENEERELLSYGLRENPKKSVKLASPEFSFAGSVVVIQDRESETESSKNPTRRRSKRIRKLGNSDHHHQHLHQCHGGKPAKKLKLGKSSSWATEQEPMSSISDTSPEEDVAYCLMMLSRDNWRREKIERKGNEEDEEEDDGDDQSDTYEFLKPISSNKNQRGKGKYKCETCFKVFKSYQALGGHRASHKKAKVNSSHNCSSAREESEVELRNGENCEEKIHECPVCFRVFASGQALGGHKRSHVIGSQSTTATTAAAALAKSPLKFGESFIDLNLPAPIDDDDDCGDEVSQIELSAVSDAEFVKTTVIKVLSK
ncbi:hypothetical protein RHGRI_001459 [Rhododendron griersonianum]|uniref:C2H2-type domain-containing protein n=1 Tax=Rhododendron griersonianum TaxID=479676 RepID=A0AAV6LN81_9ERIC|nr:hypothetical protein RHGRI_001459 [Rhododendron griersonianum]